MSEMPTPPYYAVIFPNQRTDHGDEDYAAMAARMVALAKQQPGYLGIHSTRGPDGFGITVSYWQDENSILGWKNEVEHYMAQAMGITEWYSYYEVLVAKVERSYNGPAGRELG
ncbi:MAG: antibiotic biosynthesis monooxygenase [Acidimicrobiia bacterium]|nr:antibiotic biosynthesis monooxygenase [Acidimicrobiia bacterium]RZV41566.1 MAG: antibiotic biosynthesis monooxygenase [Acidimicrobiales bacterium]